LILVDANLLLYARVASFPQHQAARQWLDARLNGTAPVGLAWPSLLAFLRIVTNQRVFERPLTPASGWQQIEAWLDCPMVWIPTPTDRHRETLAGFAQSGVALRADIVPDAHLAALAIEHGLTLCTADAGFARFPGLRLLDPLRPTRP
jgi:toxin-antitoxin system PIN domain toxin